MHSPSTLLRSASTSCFSLTFSGASTWPRGKPLDVDEEEAQVAEAEALLASAHTGVRVPEASACIVGVPAAPRGEVGAVYARGLDEADG